MTILDDLHTSIMKLLINNTPGLTNNEAAEIAAKIIYYLYAKLNNFENIISGFRQEIDTGYADKFYVHLTENTPQIAEMLNAISPEKFDRWFEQF